MVPGIVFVAFTDVQKIELQDSEIGEAVDDLQQGPAFIKEIGIIGIRDSQIDVRGLGSKSRVPIARSARRMIYIWGRRRGVFYATF